MGGVADHVHLLFGLSRTISLADLVKHLKTSSTKMMREKGHGDFSWQTGYDAFSVSDGPPPDPDHTVSPAQVLPPVVDSVVPPTAMT